MPKISAYTEATTVAAGNVLPLVQSATTKKIDFNTLRDELVSQSRWKLIASSKYTAAPSTTSVLLMSDTADAAVGKPVKFVISSVTYYGIITAVSANTSITIAGAPMGGSLTALYIGCPEMVMQVDLFVAGTYGNGTGDLLATDMSAYFRWALAKAYLVTFAATHAGADTTTEPKINVKVNSAAVSTADSNNGIQLSGTAGTWVENSAVAISTSNYDINRGEALEINCTAAGGTGDASDLTVSCTFVFE